MKRAGVIELWLAGFVLVAGLIVAVVLLGTAVADGPPMSERAHLSYSPIHNLLPTNTVYAFGHRSVVGNKIKKNNSEVDPLCNEQDGCYPYGDGCEERDYYCAGNGTGCNYTSSNRHNDSWVDTGNTRWVDENECQEKEQKEQEYRDYKCSAGSCNYRISDTKWLDTGISNSTCNYVPPAPPGITSFAPLSYVDDTVGNGRAFNVTVNQAANVSWYLNDTLVLTNESVLEAKCTLHADVVGEHSVTAIASNANGSSDMQMWIWAVMELPKECEGTDTCCGIYPNCVNCNEQDGCYPYGDGCEERDYYCVGDGTGCNYSSSNMHNDSWVDTGNTRWVDENECQEKEQKEQEYRDYGCSEGSCYYSINDTKWVDTGNMSIKANDTICGCTANNTVKRCYDGNCTDTGIGNSSNCCADVACDGKEPGESCGDGRICDSTCNCVSRAPLEITSFAPLSYVDDTVGNGRAFNVTVSQAANVSWYLNDMLVLTNESVREAKCTLHADVVGVHNVTAIASNANGSDMQLWIWNVTELPKECEGTDTCCGIYPNCGNCNEQDGCYPHGDGCEERDYYCAGNGTGCNYSSSNMHNDSWVDSGNTRWVDENECKEKEQKEQEYRDYGCSAGSCYYSINDTKWIDTGNTSIKANGTICGCTANNTVKRCYDDNCTDTGIGNSSNCSADVACDGKKPGESCGDGRICNFTCNCVSLASPGITSFTPLSYVDDTVGNGRIFNVTTNQAADVSWYLNDMLVLTDESVLEAKCMLLADVVGEHNVTAIASNANGSDMQLWIWNVTELPKECEGTDTCCGVYPNCGNCNEQDGCYPYGDGCEERDYYCAGNGTGCNYTSSNRHNDSWVDTGNTRWVDENECEEKEQKEQEYRDYECSEGSCNYSINDTKWLDTGNTSIKANGTICGCTASNTVKRCYDGNCTDTGIWNSSNCSADVACDGKKANCICGDICVITTGWWRDGGAFHPTDMPIQAAIDNAIAGETICVKDGTYTENVDVDTQLTIRSENGAASTTVNALYSNDHVFEVTADYVSISGFTANGATGSGKAGIYLDNIIDHCNIYDNNASGNNYGIYLSWSSKYHTITGNTVSNNDEYGIRLSHSSSNTISGNTASNNYCGIELSSSSSNTITDNTASNNNYGIRLYSTSNNNRIYNNHFNNIRNNA
ncbi:MAG: NosD domain-containing protein, partial [Euryarchaeota archaeon]|nr:NosD domain-containing protein [Euryarchaeota archaeon]